MKKTTVSLTKHKNTVIGALHELKTTTDLLTHQENAISKMLRSRIGALFMDMGVGKSLVAIELVKLRLKRISNTIWYCPTGLKETVRHEIEKHSDYLDTYIFDHKTSVNNVPLDRLFYVVGIESMGMSSRVVFAVNRITNTRSFVIVDESSYIKGHRSKRTDRITNISKKALYRLILSGTPLSQGVVDLFAQMRFLSPKILGYNSFYSFAANHLEYSDKYPGMIVRSHNTEALAAKIKPYVYQVTKEECLDLPPRIYKTRYFSMTPEQRAVYDETKEEILLEIDYDNFTSYTIFRLFTQLQQIVCGYRNDTDANKFYEFSHDRIDLLNNVVNEIPENEKIIIWAKFVYDIYSIRDFLIQKYGDDSIALFYGKLNEKQRNKELEKFRRDAKFFVATQSTGGHGLTLNESHYVIIYSNVFKYSERSQSDDRNYRIGQTKKVVYVDLVCSNSIDERIAASLARKGNAVEDFKTEIDKVKSYNKFKSLIEKI